MNRKRPSLKQLTEMVEKFNRAVAGETDDAVPVRVDGGSPYPTRIGFRNLFPETFSEWYFRSTQDVNLHRQVSFWSDPFGCLRNRSGRFVF